MMALMLLKKLRHGGSVPPPPPPPPASSGPAPAAVIVLAATAGGAGQVNYTLEQPTTKADGSSLPGGDIVNYNARRYTTSGTLLATTNIGTSLTGTLSGLAAGTYDFTFSCVSGYDEGEESVKYRVTVT